MMKENKGEKVKRKKEKEEINIKAIASEKIIVKEPKRVWGRIEL